MIDAPDHDAASEILVRDGDVVEVEITGLALGGSGVGRVQGLVLFVRGALPGDRVRARVTACKRSFAEAEAVEILTPSPHRVAAPCLHFGACGGCQWMDLAYEQQLAAKQAQVADSLARIGRLAPVAMHPIVPSPRTLGYRNKMEFTFDGGPDGLVAGLHRADDPGAIEPIGVCHLQDPVANRILEWTLAACREAGLGASRVAPRERRAGEAVTSSPVPPRSADDASREPSLGRLILRRGSDGVFLVVLEVRGGIWAQGPALAGRLMQAFPEVGGVVRMNGPGEGVSGALETLAGEGIVREVQDGVLMSATAGAFLQVNPEQAVQLYRCVEEWAQPQAGDELLDLFCGAGAITVRLARRVGRATGVESSGEAVRCAEANALANGVTNCRFVRAEAARAAREWVREGRSVDLLIVNPPRTGLGREMVRAVVRLAPRRAIYVSCDPATLARDLAWLAEGGLRTTDVMSFDMFPQTWHVETVVRLERAGPG